MAGCAAVAVARVVVVLAGVAFVEVEPRFRGAGGGDEAARGEVDEHLLRECLEGVVREADHAVAAGERDFVIAVMQAGGEVAGSGDELEVRARYDGSEERRRLGVAVGRVIVPRALVTLEERREVVRRALHVRFVGVGEVHATRIGREVDEAVAVVVDAVGASGVAAFRRVVLVRTARIGREVHASVAVVIDAVAALRGDDRAVDARRVELRRSRVVGLVGVRLRGRDRRVVHHVHRVRAVRDRRSVEGDREGAALVGVDGAEVTNDVRTLLGAGGVAEEVVVREACRDLVGDHDVRGLDLARVLDRQRVREGLAADHGGRTRLLEHEVDVDRVGFVRVGEVHATRILGEVDEAVAVVVDAVVAGGVAAFRVVVGAGAGGIGGEVDASVSVIVDAVAALLVADAADVADFDRVDVDAFALVALAHVVVLDLHEARFRQGAEVEVVRFALPTRVGRGGRAAAEVHEVHAVVAGVDRVGLDRFADEEVADVDGEVRAGEVDDLGVGIESDDDEAGRAAAVIEVDDVGGRQRGAAGCAEEVLFEVGSAVGQARVVVFGGADDARGVGVVRALHRLVEFVGVGRGHAARIGREVHESVAVVVDAVGAGGIAAFRVVVLVRAARIVREVDAAVAVIVDAVAALRDALDVGRDVVDVCAGLLAVDPCVDAVADLRRAGLVRGNGERERHRDRLVRGHGADRARHLLGAGLVGTRDARARDEREGHVLEVLGIEEVVVDVHVLRHHVAGVADGDRVRGVLAGDERAVEHFLDVEATHVARALVIVLRVHAARILGEVHESVAVVIDAVGALGLLAGVRRDVERHDARGAAVAVAGVVEVVVGARFVVAQVCARGAVRHRDAVLGGDRVELHLRERLVGVVREAERAVVAGERELILAGVDAGRVGAAGRDDLHRASCLDVRNERRGRGVAARGDVFPRALAPFEVGGDARGGALRRVHRDRLAADRAEVRDGFLHHAPVEGLRARRLGRRERGREGRAARRGNRGLRHVDAVESPARVIERVLGGELVAGGLRPRRGTVVLRRDRRLELLAGEHRVRRRDRAHAVRAVGQRVEFVGVLRVHAARVQREVLESVAVVIHVVLAGGFSVLRRVGRARTARVRGEVDASVTVVIHSVLAGRRSERAGEAVHVVVFRRVEVALAARVDARTFVVAAGGRHVRVRHVAEDLADRRHRGHVDRSAVLVPVEARARAAVAADDGLLRLREVEALGHDARAHERRERVGVAALVIGHVLAGRVAAGDHDDPRFAVFRHSVLDVEVPVRLCIGLLHADERREHGDALKSGPRAARIELHRDRDQEKGGSETLLQRRTDHNRGERELERK